MGLLREKYRIIYIIVCLSFLLLLSGCDIFAGHSRPKNNDVTHHDQTVSRYEGPMSPIIPYVIESNG